MVQNEPFRGNGWLGKWEPMPFCASGFLLFLLNPKLTKEQIHLQAHLFPTSLRFLFRPKHAETKNNGCFVNSVNYRWCFQQKQLKTNKKLEKVR